MVEIHPARLEDLTQAQQLWTRVFEDDAAFQRDFYALTGLDGPLVLLEDGQIQSMLALPEVTLTFPDGRSVKGGYVYALATRPEARGRGYAGQLLDYACQALKDRLADCILTVPAQTSLFSFFAKNGFAPAFRHRRVTARPAAASSPVSHRHGGIYKRAAPPRKDFGLTNGAKYGMLPNVKFIAFTF